MDALFETVGLSLGLTAGLSTFGKIVVIFTMLTGRVEPLAIALAVGEGNRFVLNTQKRVTVG